MKVITEPRDIAVISGVPQGLISPSQEETKEVAAWGKMCVPVPFGFECPHPASWDLAVGLSFPQVAENHARPRSPREAS